MDEFDKQHRANQDALGGLDPVGLLRQGASEDTLAGDGRMPFDPPAPADLAEAFPKFEIIGLIGQGGMGAVYEVRQRDLDRIVALKILPPAIGEQPGFAERFTREARALAKLNHPGIVTIHEFGQAGGYYFIVMEHVDGMNLRELLANGRISPREALAIVPKICGALQFAHDHGIIHRDIKPENILLDRTGRVKVADFGLAKLASMPEDIPGVEESGGAAFLTEAGKVMGTPSYMAPEQIERPDEVDHRADIYALGVVFYQMLTGELPGSSLKAPSATVKVDVRLDEIVLKALEKKPEMRFQQASVMKTRIEEAGESAPRPQVNQWDIDYRSKKQWFGLPLLHVTSGIDPETGVERVAKGIIAIGGTAKGVVAIGGRAFGVIAVGGFTAGIISFGGMATGLISFGGLAVGLLGALGGMGIAPVAVGGASLGWYSFGGSAFGMHALGSNANDPEARAFFDPWGPAMLMHVGWILTVIAAFVFFVSFGVTAMVQRAIADQGKPKKTGMKPWAIALLTALPAVLMAVLAFLPGRDSKPKSARKDEAPPILSDMSLTEDVTIELMVDGAMFLNGVSVGPQELLGKLGEIAKVHPNTPIKLRSSTNVGYKELTQVMELVQQAKMWNLSFVTETVPGSSQAPPNSPAERVGVMIAANAWLQLLANGKYSESWLETIPEFRAAVSDEGWVKAMETTHSMFGDFVSRRLVDVTELKQVPNGPDGDYRVISYVSVFSKKESVLETLTLSKQDDGKWRTAGYFMR